MTVLCKIKKPISKTGFVRRDGRHIKMVKTIVFVYNVNSGLFASLTDAAHKLISPKTYACNLCGLTYNAVDIKNEWREFLESFDNILSFLHKDEFEKEFPENKTKLPAIFLKENNILKILITSDEINRCKTLEELKILVSKKCS